MSETTININIYGGGCSCTCSKTTTAPEPTDDTTPPDGDPPCEGCTFKILDGSVVELSAIDVQSWSAYAKFPIKEVFLLLYGNGACLSSVRLAALIRDPAQANLDGAYTVSTRDADAATIAFTDALGMRKQTTLTRA